MTDQETCPRALEDGIRPGGPFKLTGACDWRPNRTCSYCGSWHPDDFMAAVEARTVVLGPTDKSYKVYVHEFVGEPDAARKADEQGIPFVARTAQLMYPRGRPLGGPAGKFYFQHLSVEQRKRFVELYNAGQLRIDYPGGFYRRPFFCVPLSEGTNG